MVEIEDAGWRQVGKTEDKSAIKEEEVSNLLIETLQQIGQ